MVWGFCQMGEKIILFKGNSNREKFKSPSVERRISTFYWSRRSFFVSVRKKKSNVNWHLILVWNDEFLPVATWFINLIMKKKFKCKLKLDNLPNLLTFKLKRFKRQYKSFSLILYLFVIFHQFWTPQCVMSQLLWYTLSYVIWQQNLFLNAVISLKSSYSFSRFCQVLVFLLVTENILL